MSNPLAVMARRTMSRYAAAGDMSFGDYLSLWSIDGPMLVGSATLRGDEELPPATMEYLAGICGRSSVVFAALQVRWKLFAQARYQFQQMFGGREGSLFGTPDLSPLEHPEPGETTLDLNFRAIQYADLAGDWFGVRRPASLVRPLGPALPYADVDRIKPLRPDWTVVVLGSREKREGVDLAQDPDAEIIGFGYTPGGPQSGHDVIAYGREEVAHFHPNTGPLSRYRGMPLILAALPEILSDNGAVGYRRAFFRNSATGSLAVTFPKEWDEPKAKGWLEAFEKKHKGATNAYKTIYLGGGMDVKNVGTNFVDMAAKDLAGTAETRIAAVTGMHPVIIPLSEGLAGSALNAGNYAAAKRSTSDITLRYLWPSMCGSLETIVPPPRSTRLWIDQKSVPFLAADVKDQADVNTANAATIASLVDKGFTRTSVVDAVISGDFTRLKEDPGWVSVQLQPGAGAPEPPAPPAAFRAERDFWPADGPYPVAIAAGTVLAADHPTVLGYPSLFVPDVAVTVSVPPPAKRLTAGPAPIVSRAEVEAKRAELVGLGQPSGYDSLAIALGVSRDTIRRRLTEPAR